MRSWSLHPEEKDTVLEALMKLEVEAEFPGGQQGWLKYLGNNLEYPSSLKDKHIKGEVIVTFTVNIQGKVENVQIKKSLSPAMDKEAMRVIQKSPRWRPAMQNNKKVPGYMTQSIIF